MKGVRGGKKGIGKVRNLPAYRVENISGSLIGIKGVSEGFYKTTAEVIRAIT